MQRLETLKKRSQFKIVQDLGAKWITKAFIILAYIVPHDDQTNVIHYGLIASGRLGSAVVRNRARRRLREVIRDILSQNGQAGCHYVIIARKDVITYPFEELKRDLKWSLEKLHQTLKEQNRETAP